MWFLVWGENRPEFVNLMDDSREVKRMVKYINPKVGPPGKVSYLGSRTRVDGLVLKG